MSNISISYGILVWLFAARYSLLSLFIISLLIQRFLVYWRLRHFPGPFLRCFSVLWIAKAAGSRRMYAEMDAVSKKYGVFPNSEGQVVRVTPVHS
jgi:hypothetical protein